MADEVEAGRAAEILEGADPEVGSFRLSGHTLVYTFGTSEIKRYDLRGATVEHRVKRDLPEMGIASLATAVIAPATYFVFGGGCSIVILLAGAFFAWVMWMKGHYLYIKTADGEERALFISEELAGELDLLILRIVMLGL